MDLPGDPEGVAALATGGAHEAPGSAGSARALSISWVVPLALRLAFELLVVFIGVTAAFALENHRQSRDRQARAEQVYRALSREVRLVGEEIGPAYNAQIRGMLDDWAIRHARGERPLPIVFRVENAEGPPAGAWEAALASGAVNLIDPELFFRLAEHYNRVSSLTERYRRYIAFVEGDLAPRLKEGSTAFYSASGQLLPQYQAHHERLEEWYRVHQQVIDNARALLPDLRNPPRAQPAMRPLP